MALDIETEIVIAAPPAAVWDVLVDFPNYPLWNPFILEVDGDVRLGASVPYRFEFPRGVRIRSVATILAFDPNRELLWTSHALADAIFRGDHHFRIEPAGEGSLFHHGEHFTGALVPLLAPILQANGSTIYGALNSALKQRVETADPVRVAREARGGP